MEAPVEIQPPGELSICQQRLAQHLGQVDCARVVVPSTRYLHGDLDPAALALDAGAALPVGVIVVAAGVDEVCLQQRVAGAVPRPGLADLCLDADDGLGPVGEAYAGAAIRAGEDARLGAEGAELGCGASVRSQGRGQRERGVEVGQLGGREVDVLRRGHDGDGCMCESREQSAWPLTRKTNKFALGVGVSNALHKPRCRLSFRIEILAAGKAGQV